MSSAGQAIPKATRLPQKADSDAEIVPLVEAARKDPRAFAPLYERYLGAVYRYCYVRLGDRQADEDTTSEVFLKALTGLSGFRGNGFSAWLFRIAHNSVIDSQQRRKNRPVHRFDEPEETDLAEVAPDPGPGPEEVVVARSEAQALRRAIGSLPKDQRIALELQLAGWSGEQTATVMGRSVGAVKVLRYRAVGKLRTLINQNQQQIGRNADARA
ncbi:MAG: sigma-70 family RNA polymerase sigma factor [Chloroflexota bacterium]|nr:MAG: sigma-70 family RNA polymerase sigma factor [Chloroflexota bacterium]